MSMVEKAAMLANVVHPGNRAFEAMLQQSHDPVKALSQKQKERVSQQAAVIMGTEESPNQISTDSFTEVEKLLGVPGADGDPGYTVEEEEVTRAGYPVVIDSDFPFVCYCDDAGVCAVDVAVTKCFKKPNAAGRWSAVAFLALLALYV